MPLKSSRSLDFAELTCLLVIYLAMKFKKSLIFLESDTRYSIDLWSDIEWKFLSQSSGSVRAFGSYGS